MLLNQFLNTFTEKEGWKGPMETKNGKLKMMRMLKKPYSHILPNGREMFKYTETKYFTFYNCAICNKKAITYHMPSGTENQPRICEQNKISGKGKTCHYLMNTKTLKGKGQFSNRDNLVIRSKKSPYPGWYESTYDKEGMWIETHFIWMHRIVAEEQILKRPLNKDEKVHHIDMDKSEYDKENLWICSESTHHKAHGSYNKLCSELMNNYDKYCGVEFDKETGKYYLKEKE